jgi:hypothetical protein
MATPFALHLAACAQTGLPLAWEVAPGNRQETVYALPVLDAVRARGFDPIVCSWTRAMTIPRTTKAARPEAFARLSRSARSARTHSHLPASMANGRSRVPDFKRGASKWRCPTGECQPKSKWVKADRRNPLIPRGTRRWRSLYRGRAAVEREFGRLKNEYGLAPLRVRGIERVALHADLVMLARLSQALARARVVPLAA